MKQLTVAVWAESLIGPYTGTRTVLENLIRYLLRDHPDRIVFTLVCPAWADPKVLEGRFPEGSWRVVRAQGGRWPNRMGWLAGTGSVTPIIGRHDIYMSGWHWPLGRLDEPFIGILHDLRMLDPDWFDDTVSPLRRAAWRKLWDWSVRACIARAAAIITPSQYTLDHLVQLGYVPHQLTTVIPHGIDHDIWRTTSDGGRLAEVLLRIGAAPDRDFVFSIGQHTPHKNYIRLLKGFSARLASEDAAAQLVIAGGENVETGKLRTLAVQLGLEDRVVLAGFVPTDDMHVLMSGARLFAFPSLFEGFGLPVLEAFAAGTPVVTSKTTSLGEISGDAAVLVDPTDVVEIGNAIACLWHDEAKRNQLAEAGRVRAATFRWEDAASRYLELFETVAGAAR